MTSYLINRLFRVDFYALSRQNLAMHIKNAKRWAPGGIEGYIAALAAVVIAFAIRFALHGYLVELLPFITFLIAVLLVQYRYGIGPALFASALSLPIGFYFFIPPFGTLDIDEVDRSDVFVIIGYFLVIALCIVLIESLQRSRYKSRLIADVSRSRYEILLRAESERQSALAAVRLSREHFQAFAAHVGDVIYMKRIGGGFEYVNEIIANITGVAAEDLIGDQWLSVMHPEDAASIVEQMALVLESHQPTLSEFRLRRKDGQYVSFEGKLSAMEDQRGVMLKWTGSEIKPFANADHANENGEQGLIARPHEGIFMR
jgi:PAS domain S-box-containing protein